MRDDTPPDETLKWVLADLYASADDAAIKSDSTDCSNRAAVLAEAWKNRLAEASGADLASVIEEYQAINALLGKLCSYADLAFAADMGSADIAQHAQSMRELASAISAKLVFVELEIAQIGDERMAELTQHEALKKWMPWLRIVRAWRPYQLSDEIESLLIEQSPSGRAAWVRLFDETAASLRFPIDDRAMSEAEILDMMTDPDPEIRRKAGLSRSTILADNSRLMGLILNTIAKDKSTDDRWRGFSRPVSARNLANDVDDEAVDALAAAVTARMPRLSHRYYAIKAQWMGAEKLNWWDRNAPLPGEDLRQFPWDEARHTVLDAFAEFSPQMADIAQKFFANGWIDAELRGGKASGAFSHPTTPQAHPYILLNYAGKVQDVMTLAHELGHGVHQVLANKQGYLMASTPLTLAESASVFGEMLVFQRLLNQTDNPLHRRALLAGKIEDILNTVVRQIAFHNFETRVHDRRKEGEITPDALADIWIETQAQALGPAVMIDAAYRPLWGFIPHFIHAPFYVYAYAFGDCVVAALWYAYTTTRDKTAFVANYIDVLEAGGTRRYDEALAPFGLDAGLESFWALGLDMLGGMIDALEQDLTDNAILGADNG